MIHGEVDGREIRILTMPLGIRIISSMATRALLADLASTYQSRSAYRIDVESVGGVDAARRIRAGEPFDVVVLATETIDALTQEGCVVAGSPTDLVTSGVAMAVRAGAPRPSVGDEAALKRAVLGASSIGYSTGPSGVHLQALFTRWGIAQDIQSRVVQAPPGVPVGTLVAQGKVALGFQQLSELLNMQGIDVIGPLPASAQIVTTFSAGLCTASQQADAVRSMLVYMTSADAATVAKRHGMQAAGSAL